LLRTNGKTFVLIFGFVVPVLDARLRGHSLFAQGGRRVRHRDVAVIVIVS